RGRLVRAARAGNGRHDRDGARDLAGVQHGIGRGEDCRATRAYRGNNLRALVHRDPVGPSSRIEPGNDGRATGEDFRGVRTNGISESHRGERTVGRGIRSRVAAGVSRSTAGRGGGEEDLMSATRAEVRSQLLLILAAVAEVEAVGMAEFRENFEGLDDARSRPIKELVAVGDKYLSALHCAELRP